MNVLSRDHWIRFIGVFLALLIASLAVAPYFGRHFEYYPGDLYDGRLCMFLLEHAYQWISAPTSSSLWDAPFFYPVRGVIAYSESFIGSVPFYAPWRLLGFDIETSFQLWVLTGFLLNFVAAWWVFTRLRFHWVASLFGAYVFAFSHVAFAHIGHSQLHYRFAVPLAWYFLYRFLIHFSWKDLLGASLFAAWQLYCGIYVGYFLAMFLLVFVLLTVVRRGTLKHYYRQLTPRSGFSHVMVVFGFFAVLMPLAFPYLKTSGDSHLAVIRRAETITMLPRPISYLIAAPGNLETGWLYGRAGDPAVEHVMFVGIIPWMCVFLLVLARRHGLHPAVFPTVGALLTIVVLTIYVNGFSLYFILMRLPGVVGFRGVTRWILVLLLPFSLAVAQIVHLVAKRLGGRRRLLSLTLAGIAAAAIFVEAVSTPFRHLKADAQARINALNSRLPLHIPTDAVLVYFYPATIESEHFLVDIDAMLLAQSKKVFTVNGYSATEPKGFRPLRDCTNLKLYLEDAAEYNPAFPLRDPASQVIALSDAPDWPCVHWNSPRTVQNEPLPANAFRAKIEVRSDPEVTASTKLAARIAVTNESDALWRSKSRPDGEYAIHLGCRWIDPRSQKGLTGYDYRFELPYDLPPAETAEISATVDALAFAGSYALQCDVVQELVHWFADMGSTVGTKELLIKDGGPPLEGELDVVDNEQIAGWARDKYRSERVEIEIYDENSRLGAATANIYRQDLLDSHKGDGAHGFSFPNRIEGQGRHSIRARVSGTQFELSGSPKIFQRSGPPSMDEAPLSLEGYLDLADSERIEGWAWNSRQPDRPVLIELYDGAKLVGTVLADAFRTDLLDVHKGNGKHGFNYTYRIDHKDSGTHKIRAKVAGTSFELGGSPKTVNASP